MEQDSGYTRDAVIEWERRLVEDGGEVHRDLLKVPSRHSSALMRFVGFRPPFMPPGTEWGIEVRQDSMVIMPFLKDARGDVYVLLGKEYRSGIPGESFAFPAESLDVPGRSFTDEALRGLDEETPIRKDLGRHEWVKHVEILDAGYVSPGGMHEFKHLAFVYAELPPEVSVDDLRNQVSGLKEEGERITSEICLVRRDLLKKLSRKLSNLEDRYALREAFDRMEELGIL